MRTTSQRFASVLSAVIALSLIATLVPSPAAGNSTLFFNINASDPSSYSTSAPRQWNDLSTVQRNGEIKGTSGLTYNSTTKALEFPCCTDSTNSKGYVDMGDGFNNFGSGITIEFEGHFGASNQLWERVFDFGNGAQNDNIWVGVVGVGAANRLAIEIWLGNQSNPGRCVSTDSVLTANHFDKWIITLDGTTCRMYKNGVEISTTRIDGGPGYTLAGPSLGVAYPYLPQSVTRTENYIGRSNWGTDAAFDGSLRYVRIYTSALTPQEVVNNSTTYTLTYATTGSDTGSAPAAKTGNGLITLDGNTGNLVKAGHTFSGWATSAGQTTAISGSYNLTANTTLHPVWTPNTYTVTYEEHGGSSVANGSFTHGGSLTYPTAPSRSGYTFNGWFLAANGGTAQSASSVAAGNASITLHAQWSLTPYTITYDTHGGSSVADGSYTIGSTVTLPSSPSRDGHTFDGWFIAATGGSPLGATYAPPSTGPITLHAQWTPNTYTVTYEEHGGSSVADGSFTHGGSLTYPTAPSRSGYTFNGWFLAANGGTAQSASSVAAGNASITLHAQWTVDTSVISPSSPTSTTPTLPSTPTSTTAPATSATSATSTTAPAQSAAPTTTTTTQSNIAEVNSVAPAINGPTKVRLGQQVTLVAAGFTPGETVVMSIDPTGITRRLVADKNGEVRMTVTLGRTVRPGAVRVRAISESRNVTQRINVVSSGTNLPTAGGSHSPVVFIASLLLLIGHIVLSRRRTT